MYQHQPQSTVYYSRRKPPKKNLFAILIPLLITLGIIVIVINVIGFLFSRDTNDAPVMESYLASFTVEEGKVEVFFGNDTNSSTHVVEAGNLIKLNSNEGLHTLPNSRLIVKLINNDIIRVDKDTTLFLEETKDGNVAIRLEKGSIWVKSDEEKTTYPTLLAQLDHATILMNRGSVASLSKSEEEEYISVQKGSVQAEILGPQKQVLRTLPMGIGQESTLSQGLVEMAANDPTVDLVAAQNEAFKESEWYKWNSGKDAFISDYESTADFQEATGDEDAADTEDTASSDQFTLTSHYDGQVVGDEYVTLAGTYDADIVSDIKVNGDQAVYDADLGKWKKNVRIAKDGTNTFTIAAKVDGKTTTLETIDLVKDTSAPDAPVISSPSTDDSFETSDSVITLSGTTSKETSQVIVNNYTLQRYNPGETSWYYYINAEHGNLQEGKNTFEVVSVDKAGNRSAATTIEITYTPKEGTASTTTSDDDNDDETTSTDEEEDTTTTTDEDEEETTTTTTTSSTTLTKPVVTFPANASSTTDESEVTIQGTVSSATARVTVNGYTLTRFSAGDTSFAYNAFTRFGTLKEGANTYTVIAYDAAGNASAPTTVTVNYQP